MDSALGAGRCACRDTISMLERNDGVCNALAKHVVDHHCRVLLDLLPISIDSGLRSLVVGIAAGGKGVITRTGLRGGKGTKLLNCVTGGYHSNYSCNYRPVITGRSDR